MSGYGFVGFGFGSYPFVIRFEFVGDFFIFECLAVFIDVCLSLGCSWVCIFFEDPRE